MSKLHVAIYVRVSTEEQFQEGFSIEGQIKTLTDFCKGQGHEIIEVYKDEGISGKSMNRPALIRLLNDASKNKFNMVMVWKISRISRKPLDFLKIIENLEVNNVSFFSFSENIDASTPTGRAMLQMMGSFAELERNQIVENVKMGMTQRATEGKWNGGQVLGYDNIDKCLVINEKKSKIVEEIFLLREQGLGYKAIVNILNERRDVTKKGKEFSISGVKLILENPVYIGKLKWGKYRDWNNKGRKGKTEPTFVDGIHEAIINQELWDKVQKVNKLQEEAHSNNRNFKGDLFLTGVLKCPKCGAGTVMCKTKTRNGEGYHFYYMCQAYHSEGKSVCSTNLIKKDVVEQKVIKVISELVRDDEIINNIIEKLDAEKHNNLEPLVKELEIYKKKLNSLMNKQN